METDALQDTTHPSRRCTGKDVRGAATAETEALAKREALTQLRSRPSFLSRSRGAGAGPERRGVGRGGACASRLPRSVDCAWHVAYLPPSNRPGCSAASKLRRQRSGRSYGLTPGTGTGWRGRLVSSPIPSCPDAEAISSVAGLRQSGTARSLSPSKAFATRILGSLLEGLWYGQNRLGPD